ncbi:hypothetical protein pb186bvf_011548 [Paramecium bursaria]
MYSSLQIHLQLLEFQSPNANNLILQSNKKQLAKKLLNNIQTIVVLIQIQRNLFLNTKLFPDIIQLPQIVQYQIWWSQSLSIEPIYIKLYQLPKIISSFVCLNKDLINNQLFIHIYQDDNVQIRFQNKNLQLYIKILFKK